MIDIIIPTYNSGDALKGCLKSIVNQNCRDRANVIIVNDGGNKDYDLENLDLCIKELSYSENRGPGFARNFALNNSSSELVTFIDSDDAFTDNALESLLDNIKDYKILVGLEDQYDSKGGYNTLYDMTNLHGKIYRRSIIEKYKIEFPDFAYSAEDTAFNWLYQFFISSPLKILNRVVYKYQYNKVSTVHNKSQKDFYYNSNFKYMVQVSIWFLDKLKAANVSRSKIEYYANKLFYEFYIYYKHGILDNPLNIDLLKKFYNYFNSNGYYATLNTEVVDRKDLSVFISLIS